MDRDDIISLMEMETHASAGEGSPSMCKTRWTCATVNVVAALVFIACAAPHTRNDGQGLDVREKIEEKALQEPEHPRLFFLFLLRDDLPHAAAWNVFFQGVPEESYKIFAHCVNYSACHGHPAFAELAIELVPTVPSKWCVDLVSPQIQLLKAALGYDLHKNVSNKEPYMSSSPIQHDKGWLWKFVFVSDSTLPIKLFNHVYQQLLKTDLSDLCFFHSNTWPYVTRHGKTFKIAKHSQWSVLSARDADMLVKGWPLLSNYTQFLNSDGQYTIGTGDYKWQVPFMDSAGLANWSSTIERAVLSDWVATEHSSFRRCPDEEVVSALVYGMYESEKASFWEDLFEEPHILFDKSEHLRLREDDSKPFFGRCRTYLEWSQHSGHPSHPVHFTFDSPALLKAAWDMSANGPLFARKFLHPEDSHACVALLKEMKHM